MAQILRANGVPTSNQTPVSPSLPARRVLRRMNRARDTAVARRPHVPAAKGRRVPGWQAAADQEPRVPRPSREARIDLAGYGTAAARSHGFLEDHAAWQSGKGRG